MSEPWWIEIPGLSEGRASEILEGLTHEVPHGAWLLDPARFMVRGHDRSGVELIVKCLELGLEVGGLNHLDRMGAMSMLEDCRTWLEQAEPDSLLETP